MDDILPLVAAVLVTLVNGSFVLLGRRLPERKDKPDRDKTLAEGRDTQVKTEGSTWELYQKAVAANAALEKRLDEAEDGLRKANRRIDDLELWMGQANRHMDEAHGRLEVFEGKPPVFNNPRPNGRHNTQSTGAA